LVRFVAWSSITGDNVSPHTQSGIDTSTKVFGLTLMYHVLNADREQETQCLTPILKMKHGEAKSMNYPCC